MSSKPIGIVWFCGRANIGIVLAYDEIEQKPKSYIGVAVRMIEEDEADDIQYILQTGSKFPVYEAHTLIERFGTVLDQKQWMELKLVQNKIHKSPPENNAG